MKDVTVYRVDDGVEEYRGVHDVLLHATGALVVVVDDGFGRVFAPGQWAYYDQERAEGDSEESSEKPGS